MTRSEIHAAFVSRFASPRMTPAHGVTKRDLEAVEAALRTTLPTSYVSFVTAHGPVFTPAILHELVAAREAGRSAPSGFEVQEFILPAEIAEAHRLYVSGGMDDSLVPFATDAGGSVFGFQRGERSPRPDDLPVLFFDHDFCEIDEVADSFDAWLAGYLRIEE